MKLYTNKYNIKMKIEEKKFKIKKKPNNEKPNLYSVC
jgi:hypothetical protein